MKFRVLSCCVCISGALCAANATTAVKPYLSLRSQSENSVRTLVGQTDLVHRSDMSTHYGSFSFIPEYTQSSNSDAIAEALFGWSLRGCNTLNITGSEIANRNEKDLLADWFYLDGTYQGSVTFKPVIKNAIIDVSFYWGMDAFAKGMFFRIHAPITWTQWSLGAEFKTINAGNVVYDQLYPTIPDVTAVRVTSLSHAEDFFCRKGVQTTGKAPLYELPPGYVSTPRYPLTSARFCGWDCETKTKTRLADIQADFGWDFLSKPDYHLGCFVRGVVPTGNRPTGAWLFEPIVGNGHHWELGVGLTGSALMWHNELQDRRLSLLVDAHVTHLFSAQQQRVFDLKNMPLSRYMTAVRGNNADMTPIANLTATTIHESFAAQGEFLAMVDLIMGNWSVDLGYNFWAQSCEKIGCLPSSTSCYGQGNLEDGYYIDFDATIHGYNTPTTNERTPITNERIEASDVEYKGAQSQGMSHKIFVHGGYAWMERDVVPFIGVGAEGEFGRHEKCDASTTCNKSCCSHVALSQWGVWLKGGVSF